jgi:hypothetical protein
MSSWLAWPVLAVISVLLTFVGYHFAVRTLRFVTGIFATAVTVLVTLYGASHLTETSRGVTEPFTSGFNAVGIALLRPVWPTHHQVPAPGQVGWLVIIVILAFGYRQLEAWAMHWEPPSIDTSTLGGDKQDKKPGDAGHDQTGGQLYASLAAELKFRLPAVAVRAPAILPGGTKPSELSSIASIAEDSGVTGSGLAGAIIRFFEMLWPNPRRYQVRAWIERDQEGADGAPPPSPAMRVTVGLEDARTGGSLATKTLVAANSGQAASVVAGYVARYIFTRDPTAPPWCTGSFDGDDLAATLIAGQQRAFPGSPDDVELSRCAQIDIFEKCKLDAGVARYELAQLYDLAGEHIKALRLHVINRKDYPRFYRGRYRLGMSLEMIANPAFQLDHEADADMCEVLRFLDHCRLTSGAEHKYEEAKSPGQREACLQALRDMLLKAAQEELRAVRKQLTLWRAIRAMLVHRDERAIRKVYWRLRERQSLHDGARVAELLVTLRRTRSGGQCPVRIGPSIWKALRIVAGVTGDSTPVRDVLKDNRPETYEPANAPLAGKTRLAFWQRRTPSWQAAYNTACLYAALEHQDADSGQRREMARRAITSLERAVCDRDCEMERPYDWIANDPDFHGLKAWDEFQKFLVHQRRRDYPAESRTCPFCRRPEADVTISGALTLPAWIGDTLRSQVPDIHCVRGIPRLGQTGPVTTWAATQVHDQIRRSICVPCCTGWMASLEDDVQPLLKPMIKGESTSLSEEEQTTVAAWAAMKAAVSEYIWTADPVLTAAERNLIMTRKLLPARLQVRLAYAASPRHSLMAVGYASELRGRRDKALCLTIAAECLVVQVFGGSDQGQQLLSRNDGLGTDWIGIWPPTGTVQWPPRNALDDLTGCAPWLPAAVPSLVGV